MNTKINGIAQYAYFVSYWITTPLPLVGNCTMLLDEKIESGRKANDIRELIVNANRNTFTVEQVIITNWIRLHDDDVWIEDRSTEVILTDEDITPEINWPAPHYTT